MTALAADKATKMRSGGYSRTIIGKLAAATKIWKGALCARDASGYIVNAADTAGLKVVGVAEALVDNSAGAAGDLEIAMITGVFKMTNGSDPVVQADMHGFCYVQDNQCVRNAGGNDVVAGIVELIETDGVWVKVEPEIAAAAGDRIGGIETVTTGALSLLVRTSLISVTGTKAYTLAAGLYEGQRKSLRVTVAASTPDGTLTPATFADGTSIDLDAVNESAELEWHATLGWRLVHIVGATINA